MGVHIVKKMYTLQVYNFKYLNLQSLTSLKIILYKT